MGIVAVVAALLVAGILGPHAGLDLVVIFLAPPLLASVLHAHGLRTRVPRVALSLRSSAVGLGLVTLAALIDFVTRLPGPGEGTLVELDATTRAALTLVLAMACAVLGFGLHGLLGRRGPLTRQLRSLRLSALRDQRPPPLPVDPSPRGPSMRKDLHDEVLLALRCLEHLSSLHHVFEGEGRGRVRQSIRKESRRLQECLADLCARYEGEEAPESGLEPISVNAVIRVAVASQRCLFEALNIRVRVLIGHRRDRIGADAEALGEALAVLLAATVQQTRPGENVTLSTREVAGLLAINLRGPRDEALPEAEDFGIDHARHVIALHGGELWEEDEISGFGLSLPLTEHGVPAATAKRPKSEAREPELAAVAS